MSRINTPASIAESPEGSQPILEDVKKSMGSVPNLFRLVGNSPAALGGYLALNGALGKGDLDAATRERIALAVANINQCTYCNSAHSLLGKKVGKLSDEELAANRRGGSSDAKADAAVKFAVAVTEKRGQVSEDEISTLLSAGYSEAEAVEIVTHVALNTLTNYINEAFKTEVDFPLVELATPTSAAF